MASASAQSEPSVADAAPHTATLYVIAGSHACRTAMLALELKGVPYRTRVLPTGAHPLAVRLLGFPGNAKPIRSLDDDGGTNPSLAMLDRLGTVPALRFGARRVQTNNRIIEFLEQQRPEPPLYPADPDLLSQVREAQRWGDESLQMAARRITLAGGLRGVLEHGGARGRLGALLSGNLIMRRSASEAAARVTFRAPGAEQGLLAALPAMLDRVDGWIEAGVLGGEQPNAADIVIAPSLALIDYRLDVRPQLQARPLYRLVERLLPAPAA